MKQQPAPPPRWKALTFRVACFLGGVSILVHDVFFTHLDRPWTLGLAALGIGGPFTTYLDTLRRLRERGETDE